MTETVRPTPRADTRAGPNAVATIPWIVAPLLLPIGGVEAFEDVEAVGTLVEGAVGDDEVLELHATTATHETSIDSLDTFFNIGFNMGFNMS